MQKPIIIFGSSRSRGHTFDAVNLITKKLDDFTLYDLANYAVTDFDYNHNNRDDDFKIIIDELLKHETIILATPVYWYTMSASMKRFVDRLSDLLSINKDQGRLLRGKNLALITSYSIHPEGIDGFEPIFINTAKYLGMNYLGCYFYYTGENPAVLIKNDELAEKFLNEVNK